MREEVELLSSGLASCLLNGKEVRILKISPESITVRLSEEADEISKLVVAFYMFKERDCLLHDKLTGDIFPGVNTTVDQYFSGSIFISDNKMENLPLICSFSETVRRENRGITGF